MLDVFSYISAIIIDIGTDVVGTVADATKQLQQRFISSRFASSVDEWPPYQPKHYTTLAFIHNKSRYPDAVRFSVAQQLAVAGKINTSQVYKHSDSNASITKSISDIFLPITSSDGSLVDLHILIEGAPGIGKTVLAKEIAYQWAKNELLTSKKLLLLVFLRECHQTQLSTIEQLMQYILISSKMTTCLTDYLLHTEGKDAVIIFDGFDELSEENRKKCIISDIINRRILAKSYLVITSRPTASSNFHGSVDRRVEIVGFTEEDRLDYIQAALGNCDEQVKAVQHYLQSNPTINALCYIPLNMTILLCLVEDGIDRLPKTQTEMYKSFIEMTIIRFIKKFEKIFNAVINITKLPHPHDKVFVELAKLAYEALQSDKIVFTLSEIGEGCPNLTMTSNNWSGLGLLKAVQYFSREVRNEQVTFHFLHFSIQEYMAAWYISTLSDRKQIKLLKKTFWEHRYYNTWILYVGITSGSSFALKHFLSGNWSQLYSKIFKSSKVCNKYLKHKLKCLHLFQCLIEANKEGIIESVKQLFQNNEIDLSNQTLLPSELNTLGFFLIRSINKEWDVLNLSNCNIGYNGSNILCDRFLDTDARCIVTIKTVNFSYNQLNLSSLVRLFGLFNCWHTSEIIVTDDTILDNATDIKSIENTILQSNTLTLVFIGSYLFSKNLQPGKILHVLSNTTSIETLYLLNCNWILQNSEILNFHTVLEKQKLNKVRIIGSSLDEGFIKVAASILLANNDSVNMFVYNPTMSDQIADDISNLISSSNKGISGVMLIVSGSKIQGFVNTCTLSIELSALEMFNLNIYVRYLNTKTCPWKTNFLSKSYNNEMIIYTFVKMLYKIDLNWQLKISLIENDVLIVHSVQCESVDKLLHSTNSDISIVHLSYCDITKLKNDIYKICSALYILNSPDSVELLHANLLHKQLVPNEIFICGDVEETLMNSLIKLMSHHHHNVSSVLAANGTVVGVYPNSKQIASLFWLKPSPTTWIQCTTVSANILSQITNALAIIHTEWIELDFTGCDIGDIECEIMHRKLRFIKHSAVKKLKMSLNKLGASGILDLVGISLIWRVQELDINGTNDDLYSHLIKHLTNKVSKHQNDFFLSITYNRKIAHVVCNTNWNTIAAMMNTLVSELYIINCDLQLLRSKEVISCLNITHILSRLSIINGTIPEIFAVEILNKFINKTIEISLNNVRIVGNDETIENLITSKEFYLHLKLSLLLSTKHWLYVYNVTKYQLHLIQQYFMNGNQTQPDCYGMALVRELEQINGVIKMYTFDNHLVNLMRMHAKNFQETGATQVIAALSNTTSLKTIDIKNYRITSEVADYLANVLHCNNQLQELHLNGNCLQTSNVIKITKVLCRILYKKNVINDNSLPPAFSSGTTSKSNLEMNKNSTTMNLNNLTTLTKFAITNNNITDKAADDIAAVISCNTHLQELDVGSNDLQASGIIKISRGLQMISSLIKLCINHNNITDEAADDIAAAISCNTHLQELDLGSNDLQASGIIKISRSLQKIISLIKLYINHNNITDEAADDIAAVISCNTQLQELHLDSNDLQASGIIKISRSLQKISSLIKLYINHNNITDEAADDIADAISCNTQLQQLHLGSNDFETSGIIKISRSLQKISSLIKLYVNNRYTTDEAVDAIPDIILCTSNLKEFDIDLQTKVLQKISSLKSLNINNDSINDEAANNITTIISCNKIQTLDISNNNLKTADFKKLARVLQNISILTSLYLSNNNITDEAADDITAVISCNTHLQVFSIASNHLHSVGAIKIAKGLQQNISTLTKLCIHGNNITQDAADVIADSISHNTQMEELDVSWNNFQATGVMKIAKSLQHICTLKRLNISCNNITNEAANDIASVITCNTQLEEFDVSRNYLQTMGIMKIAKSLQHICTLKKLNISYSNITKEAANDIATVITCNTEMEELDVSRNDLQTMGIMTIGKSLQHICMLRRLNISCSNITDEAANDIATVITCNTQMEELDVSRNDLQTMGIMKIAKSLQHICTLKKLNISKSNITNEAANDIATVITCNSQMEELDVSRNDLQTMGIMKIAKSLQHICMLRTLNISCSNITNEAANDIATVITCNSQMEELDVSRNDLQTRGIMKIAKSLQHICMLRRLNISCSNITNKAANDIATVITCNTQMEELDVSRNDLQTMGIMTIGKSLQHICTLKKLNISYSNITNEAANDIATVITCNTQMEELDVSINDLQTMGISKIAKSLQHICMLRRLNISCSNITNEAANDIATVITCNSQMEELDVSRNDLQTMGIMKIAKSLQRICTLKRLNISCNNITNEAANDIAAVITCNTQMEELDVSENNIQTMGIMKIGKSLQRICMLKKLNISCNNITNEAANDIAAVFTCNTQMEELDVSINDLQTMGIMKIAKSLQHICTLKKLNISCSYITNEAANDIATVITCNRQMEELDVSGNDLQTMGIVGKGLQHICTLKIFCINMNNITDEATDDIAAAISCNPHLEELDIGENKIQGRGGIRLAKSFQQISTLRILLIDHNMITDEAADDIAAAISCNPHLEVFDISGNKIQGRGAIKLAKSFQQISTLRILLIDHNMITDEAADDFVAVINHNPHLKEFRINGNKLQNVNALKAACFAHRNLTKNIYIF